MHESFNPVSDTDQIDRSELERLASATSRHTLIAGDARINVRRDSAGVQLHSNLPLELWAILDGYDKYYSVFSWRQVAEQTAVVNGQYVMTWVDLSSQGGLRGTSSVYPAFATGQCYNTPVGTIVRLYLANDAITGEGGSPDIGPYFIFECLRNTWENDAGHGAGCATSEYPVPVYLYGQLIDLSGTCSCLEGTFVLEKTTFVYPNLPTAQGPWRSFVPGSFCGCSYVYPGTGLRFYLRPSGRGCGAFNASFVLNGCFASVSCGTRPHRTSYNLATDEFSSVVFPWYCTCNPLTLTFDFYLVPFGGAAEGGVGCGGDIPPCIGSRMRMIISE